MHAAYCTGYASIGLDDGWQECGAGFDGSFHDAAGNPLVNKTKFADLAAMVSYGHSKGLRVGWYHK
jgi:alpha-galactosidase